MHEQLASVMPLGRHVALEENGKKRPFSLGFA